MTNIFKISTITQEDDLYPYMLKQIPDAPKKLFVMGDISILNQKSIAIVGSRKPTDYGIKVASYLANGLAKHLVIVSGLAYGIDTVVLKEALNVEAGLPVVAVIGSGLDEASFYPKANWKLALDIVRSGGVILSEYPLGTSPLKHHFPARNRIIAGVSYGTLVVEAGQKSGALITADLALDYNREVLAVAGDIFLPQTMGVNKLIKSGAFVVTSSKDVLEIFNIEFNQISFPHKILNNTSGTESQILDLISQKSLPIDIIARQLKLDSRKVSSTLTLMEIKGIVKSSDSGRYIRLS